MRATEQRNITIYLARTTGYNFYFDYWPAKSKKVG
jgi:hypothetical protein